MSYHGSASFVEKYNRAGDYLPFIWQRVLRLFPAYLAVLLLTLVVEGLLWFAAGQPQAILVPWFDHAGIFPLGTWLTLISSNLFLIGHELLLFQGIDLATGNFFFTGRYLQQPIPASLFIIVGQSWTLSLEIMFYLIAPLLVRRSVWFQTLVVLISVILRISTSSMLDPRENPWHTDRFFPYELAFFMAGSLGYQIYRHQKVWMARLTAFMSWFRWVFIGMVLFYSRLPGTTYAREAIFIPLLFLMIPLLFYLTKNERLDQLIGELSYPLYLIHFLIIEMTRPWLTRFAPEYLEGPIYAALAIGSAYLIYRGIDQRVDNFRHQLFARRRAQSKELLQPPGRGA